MGNFLGFGFFIPHFNDSYIFDLLPDIWINWNNSKLKLFRWSKSSTKIRNFIQRVTTQNSLPSSLQHFWHDKKVFHGTYLHNSWLTSLLLDSIYHHSFILKPDIHFIPTTIQHKSWQQTWVIWWNDYILNYLDQYEFLDVLSSIIAHLYRNHTLYTIRNYHFDKFGL